MSHSQNAALAAGGVPGGSPSVATEEWNGTNWSTSNDLIKGMKCADGFGTPAGGVAIGTDWFYLYLLQLIMLYYGMV